MFVRYHLIYREDISTTLYLHLQLLLERKKGHFPSIFLLIADINLSFLHSIFGAEGVTRGKRDAP